MISLVVLRLNLSEEMHESMQKQVLLGFLRASSAIYSKMLSQWVFFLYLNPRKWWVWRIDEGKQWKVVKQTWLLRSLHIWFLKTKHSDCVLPHNLSFKFMYPWLISLVAFESECGLAWVPEQFFAPQIGCFGFALDSNCRVLKTRVSGRQFRNSNWMINTIGYMHVNIYQHVHLQWLSSAQKISRGD